jgi:alpha-1,3-glucan synthase
MTFGITKPYISRNFSEESITASRRSSISLGAMTPTFNDSNGNYFTRLSTQLDSSDLKSPKVTHTIDDYITDSEKDWFNKYHKATLRKDWTASSAVSEVEAPSRRESLTEYKDILGENYEAPRRLKRLLTKKVGTWSIYCFLLAFVSPRYFSGQDSATQLTKLP